MKSKILFILIITSLLDLNLLAQSPLSDQLKVKTGLYYFKGMDIKFKPFNHFPFSVDYSRYINGTPFFWGGKIYHYRFSNHNQPELKRRGDVLAKFFIILCAQAGYKIQLTPKKSMSANFGLAYRVGREEQFYSIIQISPGSYEEFSTLHQYRHLGLEASIEQQFDLNNCFSVIIGGGYQYFMARTTTNHHLWVNVGLGYAF